MIFGRAPFGRRIPSFVEEENLSVPYSAGDFLPLELKEGTLFYGLTQVLDYVIDTYHYQDLLGLSHLYDAFHPKFPADRIIELLGGNDFFIRTLTDSEKVSLALMLSNLYEIKGLKRGIEGILSLLGFPSYLYQSWEVADEVETGRPTPVYEWNDQTKDIEEKPSLFSSAIWDEKIKSCNIAVAFDATGRVVLEGIEDDIKTVIESLLWVCAKVQEYVWVMNYTGPGLEDNAFLPSDEVLFEENFRLCSKFIFQDESDYCLLNKPVIECVNTPDEEKVLAIFTEKATETDITIQRSYGSPTFDGFVLPDWSLAPSPYDGWELTPWIYDEIEHEASISYTQAPAGLAPPPLFYSVGLNENPGNQSTIDGTLKISMNLTTEEALSLSFMLFTEVSGETPEMSDITAGDVDTVLQFFYFMLSLFAVHDLPTSFVDSIFSIGLLELEAGAHELVLDTLSVEGTAVTLILFMSHPDEEGLTEVTITDFEVIRYDFETPTFVDYDNYADFTTYYDTDPEPSLLDGRVGTVFDQANSTFTFPVDDLEDGQEVEIITIPAVPELASPMYLVNAVNDVGETVFQVSDSVGGDPIDFSASAVQLDTDDYLRIQFTDLSDSQKGSISDSARGWNPFGSSATVGFVSGDFFQSNNVGGDEEVELTLTPTKHTVQYDFVPHDPYRYLNDELHGKKLFGSLKLSCDVEVTQGRGQLQLCALLSQPSNVQGQGNVLSLNGAVTTTFETPLPNYITSMDRDVFLSIRPLTEGKDLDADTMWDSALDTIKSPEQFSDDTEVMLFFPGAKNIGSIVEGQTYFVINSSWDGSNTTFQISESQGGAAVDLDDPEAGQTFSVFQLFKLTISNMSVQIDESVFENGSFTFEENTLVPEEDPEYWEVNEESDFWQVLCVDEELCCPDEFSEDVFLIEIGNDELLGSLYHEDGGDVLDLDNWDFEVETSQPTFDDIVDYDGSADSSFFPVDFNWAVGTQVKLRDGGSGLPTATAHTFDEADVYYVIPYDNPSPDVWRIKLATSYVNALGGTSIQFSGNSGSSDFFVDGSQLPPEYRENGI